MRRHGSDVRLETMLPGDDPGAVVRDPMRVGLHSTEWEPDEPWPDRPPWMVEGACATADPNLFFPERGDTTTVEAAKAVCRGCAVRAACLEYALANREKFGIWGGTSERERRRLRRDRARRSAA